MSKSRARTAVEEQRQLDFEAISGGSEVDAGEAWEAPGAAAGAGPVRVGAPSQDGASADGDLIGDETLRRAFGRPLSDLLDLEQWQSDPDPAGLIRGVGEHARRVVEQERDRREPIRKLLQELAGLPDAPPRAGLHQVSEADLLRVARTCLYNGMTEAVCGDFVIHDTVPLSIAQAGVCVVGYSGRLNQWHQRLIRREMEISLDDPLAEVEAALSMRDGLSRPGSPNRLEQLSRLARRGFVSYMERRVMLTECPGRWRMGFGVPVPIDLITGGGNMELVEKSVELLRDLLLGDSRWVFVTATSHEPGLEMLAQALLPMEFAILVRLRVRLAEQVAAGHYAPYHGRLASSFAEEVGPRLVLGAYRAGPLSPPRFFFAHEERAYPAALIAMADALSLEPRGFPALTQLARASCRAALGGEAFEQLVQQAYRDAGAPEWFYRGEIA